MLSGIFENCYGIKKLDLKELDFTKNNKAVIYAPNGVAKTSLANVFKDISKGEETKDRIFKSNKSVYTIKYYNSTYKNINLSKNDNIYVIESFDEKFFPSNESIGILLADEETRKEYEIIQSKFASEVEELSKNLIKITGITNKDLVNILRTDFGLETNADWTDIIQALNTINKEENNKDIFSNIKYTDLLNDKTIPLLEDEKVQQQINEYINVFDKLIEDNEFLSSKFNDYNAEELSKAFKQHDLFENEHSIKLNNGDEIGNIKEWEKFVNAQLNEVYQNVELGKIFKEITKQFNKSEKTRTLRNMILQNKSITIYLNDIKKLKTILWCTYINMLDNNFQEYYNKIYLFAEELKKLYETANQQSTRWKETVEIFNRRFKVPFEAKINNKAEFLLKDQAPKLYFEYTRCKGTADEEKEEYGRDELSYSLSMGEKRAMYLLYILFDLEAIRRKATTGNGKSLIVVDDIADSFDYKNKYAIVEYLLELSKNSHIDLLILTHNFDFYRTVAGRLDIKNNGFIIQKNEDETLQMNKLGYRNDYFKNGIVDHIKTADFNKKQNKIKLIASIPFYRNLCDYSFMEEEYKELTCLLHIKDTPKDTTTLKMSDIWDLIPTIYKDPNKEFSIDDNKNYLDCVKELAIDICTRSSDAVILENKIVLSIAIRLELEKFLKQILQNNNENIIRSDIQTREWSNLAKQYLTIEQNEIVDKVNLMTPENIHLNSFMYEPIIDMSNWSLKNLFNDVIDIKNK